MFFQYMIAYVMLSLVVAISPIFVATLLFRPTRHFFSGWLSAAVSGITTLTLISALLAILIKTLQQTIDLVMNTAPNANTIGMVGSILGCLALTVIGAWATRKIEAFSVGIAGGVYTESAAFIAMAGSTVVNAGSSVTSWLGGGTTAAAETANGTGAATMAAAGPDLGRGP
jgi:type IV secretion system protein VirB6